MQRPLTMAESGAASVTMAHLRGLFNGATLLSLPLYPTEVFRVPCYAS